MTKQPKLPISADEKSKALEELRAALVGSEVSPIPPTTNGHTSETSVASSGTSVAPVAEKTAVQFEIPDQKTERSIDLKQAIDAVFDVANIEMRTMLTPEQMIAVNSLLTYADHYKSPAALNLAIRLMKLRVSGRRSKDGSGRADMLEAIKSALTPLESQDTQTNKMVRKLMG